MTIAYYITAHGFGHFVRSAAVIKELPGEIPLIVRTDIQPWFLNQELAGRKYLHFQAGFDCGTLGPDSVSVDIEMTFNRVEQVMRTNATRLETEAQFLKKQGVRVVVTDMPSFPLVAAKRIGLPTAVITNFTWVEIYQALVDRARAEGRADLADRGAAVVEALRREYANGDILFIPGMALEMAACRRQIPTPIIARTGRARRDLLCRSLGFDPAKPIYLLYLGQEGFAGMAWEGLREMAAEPAPGGPGLGAQFFTFKKIPGVDVHVPVLPHDVMDHADATATADAVIGKLGYSLCAECAATRTPLVFPPRPDFIEAEALGAAMIEMGLGVPIGTEAFLALDWAPSIRRAHEMAAAAAPVDCSGAQICSEIIHLAWREGSLESLISAHA